MSSFYYFISRLENVGLTPEPWEKKKKSAPMSNAKAFMREMQLFEKAEFKTEENKKHRALAQSLLSPSHIASTVFPLSEDPFSSKN